MWLLTVALAACLPGKARPVTPLAPAPPLANGVDIHVHVTMKQAIPFFAGEPGSGVLATSPNQMTVNQVDAAALRRAGIRTVVAMLWPPPPLRPTRTRLTEALHQLRQLRAFTHGRPDFGLALDAASARALASSDRIALVPAVEGAEAISSVADVDLLYAAGARVLTVVHFVDNAIADAQDDQFGRVVGWLANGKRGGLTPLGRRAVERMMTLGIAIDLAHASEQTARDVLELTGARGVPVLTTHAGSANVQDRTVPDWEAERIARQGGLIGIGVYRFSTLRPVPKEDQREGHQLDTCDDVVAHWVHYAKVAGPEHVVLGSDFNSVILRALPGGFCPDGLRHTGDLPYLFGALQARGIPRETLDHGADRFLELLERVQAAADPREQARARATRLPDEDLFDVPL